MSELLTRIRTGSHCVARNEELLDDMTCEREKEEAGVEEEEEVLEVNNEECEIE